MAKEPPPANELQVAFDLGEEVSNPPPAQADAAKNARANPAEPAGKRVKKREGGGGPAEAPAKKEKAAEPLVSKTAAADQSDLPKPVPPKPGPLKPIAPQIPEANAKPANSPLTQDAPVISVADEAGSPESQAVKDSTPQPERPMPDQKPELAAGNGSKPAEHPPAEIPENEAAASEEMAAGEISSEETEKIIQLINNKEGCWKMLPGGERVALSDEEWRSELARHFRRETPASS